MGHGFWNAYDILRIQEYMFTSIQQLIWVVEHQRNFPIRLIAEKIQGNIRSQS